MYPPTLNTDVPMSSRSRLFEEIKSNKTVVDYQPHRSSFVDFTTNKTLSGVSRACKRAFYPDFKLAKRKRTEEDCVNNKFKQNLKFAKYEASQTSWAVGSLRGSIVDSEIQAFTKNPHRVELDQFHPYTRKLIKALKYMNYTPIATQVPVYDLDRGIATAIDLICEDSKSGVLYLIEIKCGFNDNVYTEHNAQMKHSMKNVSNSPQNQHQVQASATHALFQKCYSAKKYYNSVETLIARVTDKGTYFDPLKPWVIKFLPHIFDKISKH